MDMDEDKKVDHVKVGEEDEKGENEKKNE